MASKTTSLAPKPATNLTFRNKPDLITSHSEEEWTAVYPIIENLYVRERRKLRNVMDIMEERHNFKATIQMYKKRFTKWGFYKNKPRNTSRLPWSKKRQVVTVTHTTPYRQSLLVTPKSSPSEAASLEFLTCIHDWSTSFFESIHTEGYQPYGKKHNGTINRYDPEQLSFAFRTIVELIKCGQGVLAGRLTRKAFLDVEAMLHVEAPLFVWNVLEIMYHMVRLGQTQLLNMLLIQLIELASNLYDEAHPVTKTLKSLQRAVYVWQKEFTWDEMPLLEKAWALNAENICNNCDSRLLLMYYRLVWDSSCIKLRMDQLDRLDKWFSAVGNKCPFNDSSFQEAVLFSYPVSKVTVDDTLPPKDYEIVKATCVSAIQHRSTMAFTKSNMAALVRLALVKSRILEEIQDYPSDRSITQLHHITRFQARTMAHLMKVLTEIDMELGFDIDIATDRLRSVIAMREFGYSNTAPQVIHDMWQLEAFLRRGGHKEEAAKIRMETYRRLEEYVDQVPVDEV